MRNQAEPEATSLARKKNKTQGHQIKHGRAAAPTGVVGGGVTGRAGTGTVAREGVPRAGFTRGGAGGVAEGARLAGEALGRVGDSCWEGNERGMRTQ